MDVWPALKQGGILIYSTCTFNPAENEQNIDWFTKEKGAESVELDISEFGEITPVSAGNTVSYAFYPGKARGDGFFLSALRKTEPNGNMKYARRSHSKSQWMPAPSSLKTLLKPGNNNNVYLFENKVIALACDQKEHDTIASSLNVIKSGTMIGEKFHEKITPSHDLAMSVNINREAWNNYDASYEEAIAFLSMGDFIPRDVEQGRVLICYRSVPLGFVNHLGRRANNCYPQGWRIRMEKRGIFENIL